MKGKRIASILFLIAFLTGSVFAKEKFEEQRILESENSWQEKFSIIDKKNGKYNIYVQAEDKAGNIETEGPFNIYIDPKSDLPVCGITNPSNNQRITGNLNIVGTCVDDDKVDEVWLIFDGDEENKVKAEGTDFWSYYLDTTDLLEGTHTIEVYGIDNGNPQAYMNENGEIDESRVVKKEGEHVVVSWKLDRRQPVIEVQKVGVNGVVHESNNMGRLVSGKITLSGRVTDGNSIERLEYSLNGGTFFDDVKIKEVKYKEPDENGISSEFLFTVTVDTTKFKDGAATCWFKATDGAGSVGRFAFLYFIDNTKPDVKIIYPYEGQVQNGKFSVAGYAKDVIGIENLWWEWNGQSGEFELTPGNPYWIVELDSSDIPATKGKGSLFKINAEDKIGNTVVSEMYIPIDQEYDKPLVKIEFPENGVEVDGTDGSVYLRGIAKDDDGVVSVTYKVDDGEEHTIECSGVFHADIPGIFEYGPHKITVSATDRNGIKGNDNVVTFVSSGLVPAFHDAVFKDGEKEDPLVNGYIINPESDGNVQVGISVSSGIKEVNYVLSWGERHNVTYSLPVDLKNPPKEYNAKISLAGNDVPWGTLNLRINAKDIFDRVSSFDRVLKIRDLTSIWTDTPGVFFDDSRIAEEGKMVLINDKPFTGYFAGANIASVEISPAQKTVAVSNEGNTIFLSSTEPTQPFEVIVTADTGAKYKSKQLQFMSEVFPPELVLDDNSDYDAERGIPFLMDTGDAIPKISGKMTDSEAKLKYHILARKIEYDNEGFMSGSSECDATDFVEIPVAKDGTWEITGFEFDTFVDGISVVEIIAEKGELQTTRAVFVKKIMLPPAIEYDEKGKQISHLDDKDKPIPIIPPEVHWLKGNDYYGVCLSQENVSEETKYIRSEFVPVGAAPLVFSVEYNMDPDGKKKALVAKSEPIETSSKSLVKTEILTVDGTDYTSGMIVELPRGVSKDNNHSMTVSFVANGPLKNAEYTISGPDAPGGQNVAAGKVVLRELNADTENAVFEYEADIPLANIPARITDIRIHSTDALGNATEDVKGTIVVIRTHDEVENTPNVYWAATDGAYYSETNEAYILSSESVLTAFANVALPVTAEIQGKFPDLKVETEGAVARISSETNGLYKGVSLKFTGADGAVYTTSPVNILVDTESPSLVLDEPVSMIYAKQSVTVKGKASDGNEIVAVEYALQDKKPKRQVENVQSDGEIIWTPLTLGKDGTFEEKIAIDTLNDGYIPVSVRVRDVAGKISVINRVIQKDVTPPEVAFVTPDEGMVINGENTFVFIIKDDTAITDITYESADGSKKESFQIFDRNGMVPEMKVMNDEGEEIDASDRINPLKTLNSSLPNIRIGTAERPISNEMKFHFTDSNGNVNTVTGYDFIVNEESDKPIVEIHVPEEMQVITTDFNISGVVYDDDGPCQMYFKIDDSSYQLISESFSTSYKISVPLSDMTDNEHTVSIYAVDLNGVKGDETVRTFRISLEEPKGAMTEPDISITVKEDVVLKGWASDKNGIEKVQISIDNGATFNDAEGQEEWAYTFDSRVIQDGTHVVFIRIYDCYGISALYSSLINIDNTPPDIKLELPIDDSVSSKTLFFSGQTTDNIGLTSLYIKMRSLDGKVIPDQFAYQSLEPEKIISQIVDISSLEDGFYNIELSGTDAAGNVSRVSRNIQLDKTRPLAKVSMLYPLNGEHVTGEFNIYGLGYGEKADPIEYVNLYVDNNKILQVGDIELTPSGYFKIPIKRDYGTERVEGFDENGQSVITEYEKIFELEEGFHTYQTVAVTRNGRRVVSNRQTFVYSKYGPWVTLENFTYGDFARERPLLKGKAGYNLTEGEIAELKNKDTYKDRRAELEAKKLKGIYLSFDNGKTYTNVSTGKNSWQYRVENLDIPAGYHFMLIKAEMMNGENAITRTVVQVDRTKPSIKLISPGESGRYNQELSFEGLTSDDVDLGKVSLTLRKGDKANYEVPGLIQGLYFDASFWGASLYSIGVGVTAFDGAVKVQASFGQMTQDQYDACNEFFGNDSSVYRFGGNIIGGKIIAQLAYVPFRYFFGRDWDWLSASFAIGANFSYFTDSGAKSDDGSQVAQVLSAALLQLEFPRITIAKNRYFKTVSMYTEPQLWFIPSDVAGGDAKKMVFTCSVGLRTSLFN